MDASATKMTPSSKRCDRINILNGCFSNEYIWPQLEVIAAMTAIEIAYLKGFQNVWLKSDSQLVILSFKSISVVPWCLRNRWQNCLFRIRNMRFVVTHIYREGNACVDSLANLGLSFPSSELFWSDYIPDFIRGEYIRNRLGICPILGWAMLFEQHFLVTTCWTTKLYK